MLEKDFEYFIANQEELVSKYLGKFIVIKDQQVVEAYATPLEAYLEAKKSFEVGTFLIQACIPGPEAYTVSVNSNHVQWV